MSKDKRGIVAEVFTSAEKRYRVKADLVFTDPRLALAFQGIVSSFKTSQDRDWRQGGKGSVNSTAV